MRKKASRRVRGPKVARIDIVPLRTGELFYLRALLLHRAASSFEDLRTINHHCFTTFHEAACDFGLFANNNEGFLALEEAVQCLRTPSQLRFLFAQIIQEGYPAMPLWTEFQDPLTNDDPQYPFDRDAAADATLRKIANYLGHNNKSLSDFGLPNPIVHSPEIAEELRLLRRQHQQHATEHDRRYHLLNDEQREIFPTLLEAITNRDYPHHAFFLEGRPGRGKTFLIQCLLEHCRAEQHIMIIVGTSALSATAYTRGRTAHYTFGIPVTEESTHLKSKIPPFSARADLLRNTSAIIWDELPMANKAAWECTHELCCSLRQDDHLFGGITFIGLGDFHQVAPVVSGSRESAALQASVKSSALWSSLQIVRLTTPMRSMNDLDYTKFVDDISEDTSQQRRQLPLLQNTTNVDDVVEFLFPLERLQDIHYCLSTAFLSPRHVYVDEFNNIILERLPGNKSKHINTHHKVHINPHRYSELPQLRHSQRSRPHHAASHRAISRIFG